MLLGPVFHAELLTTARRPRYYVVRTAYGLIVLFTIYLTYQSNAWRWGSGQSELPINQMAEFGEQVFTWFAIVQAVAVLMLTPALVGGTIAEERQRKTLHYLLTSRLGGMEIVLGKLGARLLHVAVLVALGLPVVSLIGLFGGVNPRLPLLTYAATATTVYFLAGLSILVSVHSRRPREAITSLYVYELIWLFVPCLVLGTLRDWPYPWPSLYPWVEPWLRYVAATSPIFPMSRSFTASFGGAEAAAIWGMGLQVAAGSAFVAIAGARVRAVSRDDRDNRGLSARLDAMARRRRWFPRPAIGDDAMMWKEKHVSRTGGLTKALMGLLAVALVGVVIYSMSDYLWRAALELWWNGYEGNGSARRDFNIYLRGVSTGIFLLWSLGVASASAGGLTSEREEDTWISLVSTPLSGPEILRAKMVGPAWAFRWLAYLMFGLWTIGLAVGSIHPLGVLACLVELAVFTWFLSAMGTAYSLRSRNSTRSLAATMATLLFLNGGYLFCCIPLQPNTGTIVAGSTPVLFAVSLVCQEDLNNLGVHRDSGELTTACILGLILYGIAAAALTAQVYAGFDAAVDRPDRLREPTPGQRQAMLAARIKSKDILYEDELP